MRTVSALFAAMNAIDLLPAGEEAPHLVGLVGDHGVGGEDDVGVEILDVGAELQQQPAFAGLLEPIALRRRQHDAVDLAALERREHCAVMAPSATGSMPFEPKPSCRDSSRASQSLSEPAVVTPIFLPLRSSGLWMSAAAPTIKPMLSGSLASAPTALAGHALGQKSHGRPGAEAEVDGIRHHPLLQFGVAGEDDGFDVQIVLRPNAFRRADLDRRKGERLADRFADPHFVGGGRGGCGANHRGKQ